MKKANLFMVLTAAAGLMIITPACKKTQGCMDPESTNYNPDAEEDDGTCEYAVPTPSYVVQVSGNIASSTNWTSDNIYVLNGRVVVKSGATLTIAAGTIIKGAEGTGTNASALIVERGAKINAVGTASAPIIFTSILDNIDKGQTSGSNLNENDKGKWGGLIILGYAPISAENGDTETQIEGIPATETYGTFGGAVAADNSGTLSYVSIRHGGALIGAGNEINGLTLGGVGSGTTINNIEVVGNVDDGIEFFGGTVNVSNLMISYQGDDGVDIDMNYSGTVDNFYVVHGTDTDEGLEIDGPEGVTNTSGLFTLMNGSVRNTDNIGTGADLKSKAQGTLSNVTFEGYAAKVLKFRASFSDTLACTSKSDAYSYLTASTPKLMVNNSQIKHTQTIAEAVDVYTASVIVSTNDVCTSSLESTCESAVSGMGTTIVSSVSGGANTSAFSWTWTSQKGKM